MKTGATGATSKSSAELCPHQCRGRARPPLAAFARIAIDDIVAPGRTKGTRYNRAKMTLRITEAELARDVRAVLEKIERGAEVIIERDDHRPLAVMKAPQPVGRKISDCIELAKAHEAKLGYQPTPDPDFAKDVQEGIDERREPIRNVWGN